MMHFWSKFGKPHFIWFWLIAQTNSQAQNGVNLDFQAQFDLEDHCQSPHKTIGILIKVFYISDPNLVILAWTVDELSHGQAHDWRTHRHTQATTIPEGQNWPRVKKFIYSLWPSDTICRDRSGSTFAQIMAWCPPAAFPKSFPKSFSSHFLNQRWLIISEVQWYSRKCNFIR